MNAKISVFVICVEAIIYLLLYNLYGCTFKLYQRAYFIYKLLRLVLSLFLYFHGNLGNRLSSHRLTEKSDHSSLQLTLIHEY